MRSRYADYRKEDLEYDQMSLVEYIDPFTGEPVVLIRRRLPKSEDFWGLFCAISPEGGRMDGQAGLHRHADIRRATGSPAVS